MKRIVVLLAMLLALLCGTALSACKQKEGKSCTNVQDCDDNLICCFDGVGANSALGVCRADEDCVPLDSGVTEDASVTQDASP